MYYDYNILDATRLPAKKIDSPLPNEMKKNHTVKESVGCFQTEKPHHCVPNTNFGCFNSLPVSSYYT